MCSFTDLRLFSLLWGETFLLPKFHVNQRLLQPSSLPSKGPSALASPWTEALEIACGAEAEAGGAAERYQAPLASLAGTGGPASLAVGLVAWLLDQSCTSQGHLHRSRSPDSSYWEHQIWLWGWQKGQPKTFWRKLFRSSDLVFLEEIVFIRRKFSSDLQSL